jgi:hypothetical protein
VTYTGVMLNRKTRSALLMLIIGSAPLLAQTETVNLNQCESGLCSAAGATSGGGIVFATVTKSLVNSHEISFDVIAGSDFALRADAGRNGFFAFNGPSGLSVTNISGGYGSITGVDGYGGFGAFDYAITARNGSTSPATITFDVTSTQTLTLADVDEGTPNFAAHILVVTGCKTGSCTGFAAGDGPAPVPETESVLLLGSVLFTAGVWVRKKWL